MLRTRVIPCLLLRNQSLVKTVQFGRFDYIGDPTNTCRIFNELEVDELAFLDITASIEKREPNFNTLSEVADECFMPLSYGGGIRSVNIAGRVLQLGFEKIILNTATTRKPELVKEISKEFGSQSVIVSIDVKTSFFGSQTCRGMSGRNNTGKDPSEWARKMEDQGAGEILLTSIDREGTWTGFDIDLIHSVSEAVNIPVIAHGGASTVKDIGDAVKRGGASAIALGSMVVYQKRGMGVLVNFPETSELEGVLK